MQRFAGVVKMTVAAVALTAVGACTTMYRSHGYVPSEEEIQQIVPGVDTRSSVEELVGVPTTSGVLKDSGYYYIKSDVKHFGWQRPEVVDRQVLAISFDSAGVVSDITSYGLEDGRVVPISRRVTEGSGTDIGFIKRLFGNVGGLSASNLLGGNN
jgi:outer membrane protein assembly factor BamE (lipoprotein component of BamABCDE complex)